MVMQKKQNIVVTLKVQPQSDQMVFKFLKSLEKKNQSKLLLKMEKVLNQVCLWLISQNMRS